MCLNDLAAETAQVATGPGERGDCGHYSREIGVVRERNVCLGKKRENLESLFPAELAESQGLSKQ